MKLLFTQHVDVVNLAIKHTACQSELLYRTFNAHPIDIVGCTIHGMDGIHAVISGHVVERFEWSRGQMVEGDMICPSTPTTLIIANLTKVEVQTLREEFAERTFEVCSKPINTVFNMKFKPHILQVRNVIDRAVKCTST